MFSGKIFEKSTMNRSELGMVQPKQLATNISNIDILDVSS